MPGTFAGTKPKAYNRHFWINLSTTEDPEWVEITRGISSRGADVSESEEEYFYMSDRGAADREASSQTVGRTFSGNRFLGDPAQDAVFIDRMYDMNKRQVEFLDYYDNPPESWKVGQPGTKGNGWKGVANISIADDGSGDTQERETIEFSLLYVGAPIRGTVTISTDVPTFEPISA